MNRQEALKDFPSTTNNVANSLLALDLGGKIPFKILALCLNLSTAKHRKTMDVWKVVTASSLPPGLSSQGISCSSLWKDEAKAMLLLDFLMTGCNKQFA